jgi:hypothetical protein
MMGPLKIGTPLPPAFVLYITCGEDTSTGKVYQVDDKGRVLGIISLPYTATGIALHREHGIILSIPRDGGKILRIDDTGKVMPVLANDKRVIHPVDVACGADSDTVLIADDLAGALMATTSAGGEPKVYRKFAAQKWESPKMSVAVTRDKNVIYGTSSPAGIYRFFGDETSAAQPSILPGAGGVAADTKSLFWAATQAPNQVYVFEGEGLVKKLRLPPNKAHYRNGLLSFAPAGYLVTLAQPGDDPGGQPWFIAYSTGEKDSTQTLFAWDKERICDFVVGPRMVWNRNSPTEYRSIY